MILYLCLLFPFAQASLASVPEDAMFILHAEKPLEVFEGLKSSSIGKFLADENIQSWLGIESESTDLLQIIAEESELPREEIELLLKGPISMWIGDISLDQEEDGDHEIIIEFHDVEPQAFENFAKKALEIETTDEVSSRWVEETLEGTTIFIKEKLTEEDVEVEGVYAIRGGKGYLCDSKAYMEKVLATAPAQLSERFHIKPDGNVWAYLNFSKFWSQVLKTIPPKEGNPITPQILSRVFGLDAISGISASMDLKEAYSEISLGVHYSERAGIMKLLAFLPKKFPTEPVVPIHAHSFNATHFDLNQMWTTLESMVYGLNPEFETMLQTQLENILRPNGEGREIHLRENLLQGIGQEWYTYNTAVQFQGETAEGTVFILSHRGQKQLEKGMDDLLYLVEKASEALGGTPFQLSKIDFQGHPSYQLTSPILDVEGEGALTVVLTERWILMGGPNGQVITEGLAQLETPSQNVWQQSKVKTVAETFEGQPVFFGFGEINTTFVKLLMTPFQELGEAEMPSPESIAEMFGSFGTAYYLEDQKFILKARLFNVP